MDTDNSVVKTTRRGLLLSGGGKRGKKMRDIYNGVNKKNFLNEQALAGVAQWIEHRPENQRVGGSIPSQGTCLGCGPGPQ